MSSPHISYVPHSDTTSEGELNTLVAVYRFILDSAKKKGSPAQSCPEDAERRSDEIGATSKYT